MSIQVRERAKRTVKSHYSDGASTREYSITGAPTEDVALTAIQGVVPGFNAVGGVDNAVHMLQSIDLKEEAVGFWVAVVHYGKNQNTAEITFDFSAKTFKATTSLETIASYNCDDQLRIPRYNKGIGWDGKKFEGVDIEVPSFDMTYNRKYVNDTLPAEYLPFLFRVSQTVNDNDFTITWRGQTLIFLKGTLRFRGFRAKQDSAGGVDISYSFNYMRATWEDDGLTIGDSAIIEKEGQQYMWTQFKEKTVDGRMTQVPQFVFIEKVYPYSDFNDLML